MSGVEDVVNPPPDETEKTVEKEELSDSTDGKEEDKASLTTSLTDSGSTSLTGSTSESWTLLEKEADTQKKNISLLENGAYVEEVDDLTDQTIKSPVEDVTDSGFPSSLTSTTSTISVASDGIPIMDKSQQDGDPQYEWNDEGEREIPEEEAVSEEIEPVEIIAEDVDIPEDDEEIELREESIDESDDGLNYEREERRLEPSEPGYDLDDDGLPGAPLPPLAQEVELYPSQELDPNFPIIKRGEVYKHDKNLQLDHFLTAILILALALVIGLGIGHFVGLFLSVTTSIHSSITGFGTDPFEESLGVGIDPGMIDGEGGMAPGSGYFPFPDKKTNNPVVDPLAGEPYSNQELPGDEFIDDFRSVNDFDINPEEKDNFNQHLQDRVEPEEPFSIFGSIKNVFSRLGTKLGYIKKSPVEPIVSEGLGEEQYYSFQCMTADDQPIMINNQPVVVSEPQECNQYYIRGQEEGHASQLEPPAYFMESAKTAFKSDDQDLDDKVIRQLWDENQELRDQVHQLRTSSGDPGDEAMAALLRDKINDLLTANADLEREVARLRYADAARGAAESVETLNKLRKTRDTLNDIVTENDQLKIEVAKARYGEPPAHKSTKAERDLLASENQELKNELEQLKISNKEYKSKASENMHEKFENALKFLEELTIEKHVLSNNNLKQDDLNTPWPTKRHEELKNEDGEDEAKVMEDKIVDDDNDDHDNDDDDDDDIKSTSMNNLSKYLSTLVGVGSKILTKQGTIDWVQAKKFVGGLKEDISTKFEEAGKLAKEDIGIIVNKFDELKTFVDTEKVKQNMKATQTAAGKLVKSLVGAVKDLKEASEDAAEKSDWMNKFKSEAIKVKSGLETKWYEIKDKWQKVIVKNKPDNIEDDDDDDDEDDQKEKHKYRKGKNDDEDQKEKKKVEKTKLRGEEDDDEDEGYSSYDEKKRNDEDDDYDKRYKKRNKRKENDNEDEDSLEDRKYSKNRKEDPKKREYWTKKNKTGEESENWAVKRAEEREKTRRREDRSDWIFERAKHRKDARHEETRERKQTRDSERHESDQTNRKECDRDDEDCKDQKRKSSRNERNHNMYDEEDEGDKYKRKREYAKKIKLENNKKQRGERFSKSGKKFKSEKKMRGNHRGETNQWGGEEEYYQYNDEVQYSERQYDDASGKKRYEKRAKRRMSTIENEKEFVIEADFEQFY